MLKKGQFVYPWPDVRQCMKYCDGPFPNNQFVALKGEKTFNPEINELLERAPELSWSQSPLGYSIPDYIKVLHGGPREGV